jgi:hypothetical protein
MTEGMSDPRIIKVIDDHNARVKEMIENFDAVFGVDKTEIIKLMASAYILHEFGHMAIDFAAAEPDRSRLVQSLWCGMNSQFNSDLGRFLTRDVPLTGAQLDEMRKSMRTLEDQASETYERILNLIGDEQ